MNAEPVSATIQVDMEVERFKVFREDNMIQIWGYVGDYQVSVWFPLDDPRVKPFVRGSRRT